MPPSPVGYHPGPAHPSPRRVRGSGGNGGGRGGSGGGGEDNVVPMCRSREKRSKRRG